MRQGKKHSEIQISQSSNIGAVFFGKSNKDPASKKSQKNQRTMESFLVPVSTLQAEVFFPFKVGSSHFSLKLCLGFDELFLSMFADSKIVKSFQLSKTKYGYIMKFGLAPYFKDLLLKEINASDCFRLSFDENINKVLQEEQMDV